MMAEETRDAKLRLGVETKGVDKSVNDLKGIDREIDKLTKDIRQNFDKSVNSVEKLTDEIRGDLVSAIKEADKAADGIDIKSPSGGGGNAPAAAKFRGAASLVGGGDLIGLIDDFQDLGEGLMELKSAAPGAAQGLMSLAASMGPAGLLAAGAATIAVVALGAVLKTFADERAKEAETVRNIIEANKNARTKAIDGATTADLEADIERLTQLRQLEADQIEQNTRLFEENFMTADGFVDTLKTLGSTLDDELAGSTANSEKAIRDYDIEMQALRLTIDEGRTAANDTKVEEQELAEVRQNETPQAIETAKNAERDRAREMEKVAREQERAAAEAAREQERIAAEQQRRAEQAAAAQQKYADGIKNANTALKQATADINTKLSQGLADNLESMFRDVTDITTQYRRDTFDMDLKANQAERDALTEHMRDIEDIKEDSKKSELEAQRDGDFKQQFLAREAGADALKQEQKETLREKSDRQRALGDERADLLRNAERTRSDRMLALERQNADTRTAAQRELQQAALTRTRALEMNAASYKSELAALGTFLQQRNQLLSQANQAALAQIGGGRGNGSGLNNTGRSIQNQMAAAVGGIIRR